MQDLWSLVSENKILNHISDRLRPNTYLVGGCIRDMLLGRQPDDFDIVTFRDVWTLAQEIAAGFGTRPFWMDRSREIVRISLKKHHATIDISSPKGQDIEMDLAKRDITINAMGYDVAGRKLIDPVQGIDDLEHSTIRMISEDNLKDDPLRSLRSLRFSVVLGFDIDEHTLTMIRCNADLLYSVSPERIRQELMKALCFSGGAAMFALMNRCSVTDIIFPEYKGLGRGTHEDMSLLQACVQAAVKAERLINNADAILEGIGDELDSAVEEYVTRAGIIKLAAFLYNMDIANLSRRTDVDRHVHKASEKVRDICAGLRFSNRAAGIITGLIENHRMTRDCICSARVTNRDMHGLCKVCMDYMPETLLLALAATPGGDGSGTDIRKTVSGIWTYYHDTFIHHKNNPLIRGGDVVHALGIRPGPMVGMLLERVEDARAEGIVQTKEQALEYIRSG